MTTTRRNYFTTGHDRSPFILERRRNLFPTENHDVESDLGHISPLSSDTTSDSDNDGANTIADFDIVGIVQTKTVFTGEMPVRSETMSPLIVSPCLRETPNKHASPSRTLKTPHDTSTKPGNFPQKEQKILLEESKSLKRKCSSASSPEYAAKVFKVDSKSSKVRTALFPPKDDPNTSLSVKSFYPKCEQNIVEKRSVNKDRYVHKPVKFSAAKHSRRNTKKFGQINNGVRHKIRKPKQKKGSKTGVAKVTKKLLKNGSVLNEYILDLSELKKAQNSDTKLIINPPNLNNNESPKGADKKPPSNSNTPLKNQIFSEANKENVPTDSVKRSISPTSPISVKEPLNRKFFKSSRVKPVVPSDRRKDLILNDTGNNNGASGHNLRSRKSQNNIDPTVHFDPKDLINDFQEEEVGPQTNIDNILSALTDDSPEKCVPSQHFVEKGVTSQFVSTNTFANSCTSNSDNLVTSFDAGNTDDSQVLSNACQRVDSSANLYPPVQEYDNGNPGNRFDKDLSNQITSNAGEPTNVTTDKSLPPPQNSLIVLEAHNSVTASENSIQIHADIANMILSPISQMCDVTSGLALNSPKKRRDLTSLLNNMPDACFNVCGSVDMEQQKKLYPIFSGKGRSSVQRGEKRERNENRRNAKRFKALPEGQMLLDAGQKRFGYTVCNECNIVYHMGDPGDELEHMNYHNASHVLRFAGWKNEHVMVDFQKNGRIIRIMPTDSKIWLKKVKDLMEVVKRELGCFEMDFDVSDSQVYLYIKNRTIAGCVVATVPKQGGHKMLSTINNVAMCSQETYPIKCGVSYIWVAASCRKQGVATALLDAVKNNFCYGSILSNADIALTSPTEAGAAFAEKYFKSPNYMVYYM